VGAGDETRGSGGCDKVAIEASVYATVPKYAFRPHEAKLRRLRDGFIAEVGSDPADVDQMSLGEA
ncbi:MAG: hypothetical protein K2Q20_09420, partial [Phycisphaerales bacterium]|nr:hypothetical protein [Phycisphaerales bacterium]